MRTQIVGNRPIQTRMKNPKSEFLSLTTLLIESSGLRYVQHSNWNADLLTKFVSTTFKPYEKSETTLASPTAFNFEDDFESEDVAVKPKYVSECIIKAKISKIDKSIPKIFVD